MISWGTEVYGVDSWVGWVILWKIARLAGLFYGRCEVGLLNQEVETASGLHVQAEQRTEENEKASGQIPRKGRIPDSRWQSDPEASSPGLGGTSELITVGAFVSD